MDFDTASTSSLLSDSLMNRENAPMNATEDGGRMQYGSAGSSERQEGLGASSTLQIPVNIKPRSYTANSLRPSLDQDFYDSIESTPNNHQSPIHCFTSCVGRNRYKMSSHRIPPWAWVALVHMLGIKHPSGSRQRSCLAFLLKYSTILLACTFTVTGTIHTIYDINSRYSDTSLGMGLVNLVLGFGWICLGIYSNKVAASLFSNRNFVESVRIHSRTFFKISAVGLLIFLGCGCVALNGYRSYVVFGPKHCETIVLNPAVCHVMYSSHIAFSVISLVWNLLVGCVLLSVCRTHTVGIRRFIKLLEEDSHIYDILCKGSFIKMQRQISKNLDYTSTKQGRTTSESEWFIWDDHLQISSVDESLTDSYNADNGFQHSHRSNLTHGPTGGGLHGNANQFEDSGSIQNKHEDISILTNEELLISYWKISNRMRITSKCLQRWLASWIVFVILWCSDYIIYWISHKAYVVDIAQCLLPLLLIFIVCTAFAEANGEGQHMIRCICPTEERLHILRFLTQQPLQMQVFNFSITYNALVGVMAAFAVAFASRIVLDEVVT